MLLVIFLLFSHYNRIMEQYQNNEQLLLKCLGLLVNLTSSSRVCACVCVCLAHGPACIGVGTVLKLGGGGG